MPGSAARAITVGAMNRDADTIWAWSNWGNTTRFYAPGQFVESAHTVVTELFGGSIPRDQVRSEAEDCTLQYPHDTCRSGTSFSSPIVAGIVARYGQNNPYARRDDVVSFLDTESSASTGVRISEPYQGGTSQPLINLSDYTGAGVCP